jgi:hypothetical protein
VPIIFFAVIRFGLHADRPTFAYCVFDATVSVLCKVVRKGHLSLWLGSSTALRFGAKCMCDWYIRVPNHIKGGEAMDAKLLKISIEILDDIRSKIDGAVDDSVINQLDKVIQELEADYKKGNSDMSSEKLLFILGKSLEHLPLICELVEKLVKKMQG